MNKGRGDRGSPRLQPTHLELQELRGPVVEENHPRRPEGRWRSGHGRLKWEGDKAGRGFPPGYKAKVRPSTSLVLPPQGGSERNRNAARGVRGRGRVAAFRCNFRAQL